MAALGQRLLARAIKGVALGLLALALGGFLVAWSGLYNVAASRGHWAIVDWFLRFALQNSVELYAGGIDPPPLDDSDMVRLGAAHFHGGCAYCHGAPGVPISPIAQSMLPPPPDLSGAERQWEKHELFWIVKHGIKYAGMPAWPAARREDEVWSVVAFLLRLPELDARTYRELALGDVDVERQSGKALALEGPLIQAVGACARCHGSGSEGPASRLVPILHGQPAEYLEAALLGYARGEKQSGIMQPVAAELSFEAMKRLATYYAGLAPPVSSGEPPEGRDLSLGKTIATAGLPDSEIPPCLSCHGPGALAAYPRLAGQNAEYLVGQLRQWRAGPHRRTETAAIMAPIGKRLTDPQIEQVAAYLASLPRTP